MSGHWRFPNYQQDSETLQHSSGMLLSMKDSFDTGFTTLSVSYQGRQEAFVKPINGHEMRMIRMTIIIPACIEEDQRTRNL